MDLEKRWKRQFWSEAQALADRLLGLLRRFNQGMPASHPPTIEHIGL
jgi:hypothetical protein